MSGNDRNTLPQNQRAYRFCGMTFPLVPLVKKSLRGLVNFIPSFRQTAFLLTIIAKSSIIKCFGLAQFGFIPLLMRRVVYPAQAQGKR